VLALKSLYLFVSFSKFVGQGSFGLSFQGVEADVGEGKITVPFGKGLGKPRSLLVSILELKNLVFQVSHLSLQLANDDILLHYLGL
jgi:hypothetical protein